MDEVLEKINELYGLKLELLEKVTKGFLSENHVLIDTIGNKKYFLKQYRFDKEDKIKEIHLAKKYFFEKGIPVIMPIEHNLSSTFFYIENKYFALFPFVLDHRDQNNGLSDKAIVSLGKMLGRIHLAGKNAQVDIKEKFEGWNKEKLLLKAQEIKSVIQKIKTPNTFDKKALKDLELRRSIIESNNKTFEYFGLEADHLIQGDYHADNVFFDENDEVSHVFDFEKSFYAPRMFELFRAMVFLLFRAGIDQEKMAKARIYLQAYLSVYPAPKEELKKGLELFYLRFVHGFWVVSEHYLKGNTRVDQFLSQDYERIKYFSENLDSLADKLIN